MVKENIIIPKENYEQVEEVREIDYQVPSFEEFMKSYEGGVNYADLNNWDVRTPKSYGPGNSQSGGFPDPFPSFSGSSKSRSITGLPSNDPIERFERQQRDRRRNEELNRTTLFVTKTVAKATAATVLTTATGGLAPFIGGGAWIGGEWLKSNSDEFLQFLGGGMSDLGSGMFSGGLFASSTIGEFARKSGIDLKKLENFFEIKGKVETGWAIAEHNKHRNEGISYKSNCELCRL